MLIGLNLPDILSEKQLVKEAQKTSYSPRSKYTGCAFPRDEYDKCGTRKVKVSWVFISRFTLYATCIGMDFIVVNVKI
jgi:hypothetical protein